jgi:copper homeostasis protein
VASQPLLEITVESLDTALAAERAGADRIELCTELRRGGLTPSAETMRKLHEELEVPIFPIIRPRAGDFVYAQTEINAMKRAISNVRDLGMEGVVLGILLSDRRIDVERTTELVEWARPLEVTFHRAFDQTPNLLLALEDAISAGASRILTSGGAAIAPNGVEMLRKLVRAAANRIVVMPGSGLDATNIARIAAETRAAEFHSGLSTVLPYGSSNLQRFESEIHAMKRQLRENACSSQPFLTRKDR